MERRVCKFPVKWHSQRTRRLAAARERDGGFGPAIAPASSASRPNSDAAGTFSGYLLIRRSKLPPKRRFNDDVDLRKLWVPTELLICPRGGSDKVGRIAGPSRAEVKRDCITKRLLHGGDDLENACSFSGAQVERVRAAVAQNRLARKHVRSRQIRHMHVVTDRTAVERVKVLPIHCESSLA